MSPKIVNQNNFTVELIRGIRAWTGEKYEVEAEAGWRTGGEETVNFLPLTNNELCSNIAWVFSVLSRVCSVLCSLQCGVNSLQCVVDSV